MTELTNTYTFGSYPITCRPGSRLDSLCLSLRREFPNLVMRHKRELLWHRILHYIILIFTFGGNDKYLSRYTTTGKDLVFWSDGRHEDIQSGDLDRIEYVWGTLLHEREHLREFSEHGWVNVALRYVLVYFPLGLAYGRAIIERRGYAMTIYAWYVRDKDFAECRKLNRDGLTAKQWWVNQFTTGAYGWMMLYRTETVERWYDDLLASVQCGALNAEGYRSLGKCGIPV